MKKEDFIALGVQEELAKKLEVASQKELEGFVPREQFDQIETQLEQANSSVSQAGNGNSNYQTGESEDVEGLKKTIADLQADNKNKDESYQIEIRKIKRDGIDFSLLSRANAKNITAVKALLAEIDSSVDEQSYTNMRTEQIKAISQAEDTKFLFENDSTIKGFVPGEKSDRQLGFSKERLSSMSPEEIAENWREVEACLGKR